MPDALPLSVPNRALLGPEVHVLQQCASRPCGRLDFRGVERMALFLLARRGWLQEVVEDGTTKYRTVSAGIVALSVSEIIAAG